MSLFLIRQLSVIRTHPAVRNDVAYNCWEPQNLYKSAKGDWNLNTKYGFRKVIGFVCAVDSPCTITMPVLQMFNTIQPEHLSFTSMSLTSAIFLPTLPISAMHNLSVVSLLAIHRDVASIETCLQLLQKSLITDPPYLPIASQRCSAHSSFSSTHALSYHAC